MDVPAPIAPQAAAVRRLRGPGIGQLRALARASMPEARWEAFLAEVPAEVKPLFLASADPMAWVETDLLRRLLDCLPPGPGVGLDSALSIHGGPEWVQELCPEAFEGPVALAASLPRMWALMADGGLLQAFQVGVAGAEVDLWATVPLPDFLERFVPAWIAQALVLSGARNPRVTVTPPPPGRFIHRYHLAWDGPAN